MVKMKADVLKIVVAAMSATLLTGTASWVSFGQDKITRPQMVNYVEHHGPISSNTKNIERLEKICDRMVTAQQQLLVEQRVLITKVDALVGH